MSIQSGRHVGKYDIGVAIMPLSDDARQSAQELPDDTIPGYDDAFGQKNRAQRLPAHIETGEETVRTATEAMAAQIGIAARRIATAIDQEVSLPSTPGSFDLESVEVSFGVSLAAGVQALFTAQAESSAQVTVRLSHQRVTDQSSTASEQHQDQ